MLQSGQVRVSDPRTLTGEVSSSVNLKDFKQLSLGQSQPSSLLIISPRLDVMVSPHLKHSGISMERDFEQAQFHTGMMSIRTYTDISINLSFLT